jgi:hypothetical protein
MSANPVNVTVTIQGANPTVGEFGRAAVFGCFEQSIFGNDQARVYTNARQVAEDFTSPSHPMRVLAEATFSQGIAPNGLVIARLAGECDHEVEFAPLSAIEGNKYSIFVNGTEVSHVAAASEDENDIVTALSTSLNSLPISSELTYSVNTDTLFVGVSQSNDIVSTHIDFGYNNNMGFVDMSDYDLAQALAVTFAQVDQDFPFAAFAIQSNHAQDIVDSAAWAEANSRIFFGLTNDSDVATSSTSDVATTLNGLNRKWTALYWSNRGRTLAAASLSNLGLAPGSLTWAYQTYSGVRPNGPLSGTQKNFLAQKKVNFLNLNRGVNYQTSGFVSDGTYIDTTRDIEFLKNLLETEVFRAKLNNDKIPFNEIGFTILSTAIRQALDLAVEAQIINEGYTLFVPSLASVPPGDKVNRELKGVEISAVLTGAVQEVFIDLNLAF